MLDDFVGFRVQLGFYLLGLLSHFISSCLRAVLHLAGYIACLLHALVEGIAGSVLYLGNLAADLFSCLIDGVLRHFLGTFSGVFYHVGDVGEGVLHLRLNCVECSLCCSLCLSGDVGELRLCTAGGFRYLLLSLGFEFADLLSSVSQNLVSLSFGLSHGGLGLCLCFIDGCVHLLVSTFYRNRGRTHDIRSGIHGVSTHLLCLSCSLSDGIL